ncbi:MAG: ectoine utilization protein EutC [Lautropia sp.]
MSRMKILTEVDLRKLVPLDLAAVRCVEDAFRSLATKAVVMPPILRLDVREYRGEVDVKTAYVPGLDSFAIKISPGYFDNPKLGLPSTSGLMALFSSKTGVVQAVLLDNGYLTDLRTAAAGAVAAQHLATKDASIAALLGAGNQAALQLQALVLVRPIREARIWARNPAKAASLARKLSAKLNLPVTAYGEAADAVAGSHVIVSTTSASQPILKADWLEPGQHVTAVGSDAEHKNEIEPAAIRRADLYVADRLSQTRKLGELHHAISSGDISADAVFPELGEVITGSQQGRTTAGQITMADLTGTGIQDTAIATFAFSRAEAAHAGLELEN